jgi:2-polyprenyl-3-methyl-5-hydroxy-6-metoxy-1,4-benzoquinol methylase
MENNLKGRCNDLQSHWQTTKEYSQKGYENSHLERRKYLAKQIVETKPKSVLEIGCFGGYNLREIHELDRSIKLTGFDINDNALKYAKEKLPVLNTINGSIYELDKYFKENQFDVVFTAGVLIHIPCSADNIDNIKLVTSSINKIAKLFIFHAEENDKTYYNLPNKHMRYVHNFNDLYKLNKDVQIQPSPVPGFGFEHIIKVIK